jgi:acetyl-CoA synthetase
MMFEQYRVYDAMLSLGTFTAEELSRACHVSSNTARTIIHRNRQLLELVDHEKTGKRGGSWARYRLLPEGLSELRRRVAHLDERGLTSSLRPAAPPAALISAEDILLDQFPAASDPDERTSLIDSAHMLVKSAQAALAEPQEPIHRDAQAHLRVVNALLRLAEAEQRLLSEDGTTAVAEGQLAAEMLERELPTLSTLQDASIFADVRRRLDESSAVDPGSDRVFRPHRSALAALAEQLPDELIGAAVDAARRINDNSLRSEALATLAERLPEGARASVIADALDAARDDQWLEAKLEAMLTSREFEPPEDFRKDALLQDPAIYKEAERDWKGRWLAEAKKLHWFKKPTKSLDESEAQLEAMLTYREFEPPEDFRKDALLQDPAIYEEAERDWKGWWLAEAKKLHWFKKPTKSLDESNPPFYKWFADGKLNASYNCLDRHVKAGHGDRIALHWRGEGGEERDLTYADFHRDVQRFANALKDLGIRKGDIVGIYLPMIPEVIVAMLACARIGAPHNVVYGEFAPPAVRERMEYSEAKALITVDGARRRGKTTPIKQQLDKVMADLETLEHVIVIKHTGAECEMQEDRDVWFHEVMARANPKCLAERLEAEHPLFVLYTSGSTAKSKGVVHTTGGYLTGVRTTHRYVFDFKPETDVFWCSADVGWVTGHSYVVYGPMANGATSVMYEGEQDYPHKGIWWELCERYGVTIFYTMPTAIGACVKWGAEHVQKYDLSNLRLLGNVGEPINPKAWLWYHVVVGGERCPIVDTWWQNETGAIMITPLPGITATTPGSATQPFPGIAAEVVSERDGAPVGEGPGLLVITRPWPSMLRTLYNDDERFVTTYFKRFGNRTFLAGDAARKDKNGHFWITGRIDDVVITSGHRLSTAEVESAIVSYPQVAEAAVIGQSDKDTGQAIVAYVTLQHEDPGSDQLFKHIQTHVAEQIGKFAQPKRLIWVEDLPKTRSGKIMRRLLRDIAEGRALGDVTTLRDPVVMAQLEDKIHAYHALED